jgi:hypothetical protein
MKRILIAVGVALGLLAPAVPSSTAHAAQTSGALPLTFAANAGQTGERVRYLAQGAGYSFLFADDRAVLSFARADRGLALEVRFVGAGPDARLEAGARAAGTVNHLTGESAAGLPAYQEIAYRDLWPGIDLLFRGVAGTLEYEFHIRPGADPSDIRLDYAGADGLSLGLDGSLTVDTALGELRDSARTGAAVEVRHDGYGFAPGRGHHHDRPFVIGRDLAYSAVLGGTAGDAAGGIALDKRGSAYVTGETASAGFPTTPGAYDPGYNANTDVFVTKLDRSGSKIVYSTFIGGSAFDSGHEIAVDKRGGAYITGFTGSLDYPTTPGSFDTSHNGGGEAFVTKLSPSGSALEYSTFLGGEGFSFEGGNGIAVDDRGGALVTGFTGSGAFPTTPGAFDTSHNGRNDAFLTKLDPTGSTLTYSTFLGGAGSDVGNAVAFDDRGDAHVTGFTASADYPTTPAAPDTSHNGANDAFVSKLDPSGAVLEHSTFLGGAGNDVGNGIAVDEKRRAAHVTGSTASADYPTTRHAYDRSHNGGSDAFVARLDRRGSTLEYSTYLGGAGSDAGNAIAVDEKGDDAHLTGSTDSADYPTTRRALDRSHNGGSDAFVTTIERRGSALEYSTYLGGAADDAGNAIAVDGNSRTLQLAGSTTSPDFPATSGNAPGAGDAFVTALRLHGWGH